jgi:von Willebrand factor A domain-containing protein 7
VDTTGSMSDKTMDVIAQASAIVDERVNGAEEPLKYILSAFNDPQVGPVTVTEDADEFKSALGALRAEDGEECEEPSMAGLLNAISASDEDGEVFLFTDASAKDNELAGAVSSLAEEKKVKVYTALSGTCSPIDPTYVELTRRTGGQLLFVADGETAQLGALLDAVVRSDLADILSVSETLAGTRSFDFPIDSTLGRVTLSVSVVRLDASRGAPPTVTVTRPDGYVVASGDPGVHVAALSSAALYTITDPAPGSWNVSVTGNGALSLKVLGASGLRLEEFELVREGGDSAHPGLFAISGSPAAGAMQTGRATLSGDPAGVAIELRSESGAKIADVAMAPSSETYPGELFGEFTVPPSPFVIYATGTDLNGFAFQRVLPRLVAPRTVAVRPPPDALVVDAGATATFAFTVRNLGADDSFRFGVVDTRG